MSNVFSNVPFKLKMCHYTSINSVNKYNFRDVKSICLHECPKAATAAGALNWRGPLVYSRTHVSFAFIQFSFIGQNIRSDHSLAT